MKKEPMANVKIQERIYTLTLTTELLGTVPLNKEIFGKYIEPNAPDAVDTSKDAEDIEESDAKGKTGFFKDEEGLYIMEYMIKGFLKAAGYALKDILGISAMKSKIDNFVFIEPRKIHLMREVDGKLQNIQEPDGSLVRPLRSTSPQGWDRVSLANSDYLNPGAVLTFNLVLLPHRELTWKVLDQVFQYGRLKGLGQFRNGGYGKFNVVQVQDVEPSMTLRVA